MKNSNCLLSPIFQFDRWRAKREVGVFLKMLAIRAYGLRDDAAEELAVLSQRVMPDEEFGIVYPGSEQAP